MTPWDHPAEFRRRAVDLVEAGSPVAQAEAESGICGQSILIWRRLARVDTGVATEVDVLVA